MKILLYQNNTSLHSLLLLPSSLLTMVNPKPPLPSNLKQEWQCMSQMNANTAVAQRRKTSVIRRSRE
jgi:hypothetical protein